VAGRGGGVRSGVRGGARAWGVGWAVGVRGVREGGERVRGPEFVDDGDETFDDIDSQEDSELDLD